MDLAAKLSRLGVRRLVLAIHDVSFPSDPDEDLGRGSPSTRAADRLLAYARGLGVTGIQLGPQGQTSRVNASPYDATMFSRHLGTIAPASLRAGGTFEGLVAEASIDRWLAPGGPARNAHAFDAYQALVAEAHAALVAGARADLAGQLVAFRRDHARWLVSDALFAAICAERGTSVRSWPEAELWRAADPASIHALIARHAIALERYALGQLLAHAEHARLRERCRALGLALYGDLQVGFSEADAWAQQGRFLRGYVMGAPPSRTNPEGQPWNYPVFDPARPEAARDFAVARLDKAFAEYDGLRVDHPHGLVCPWVYRDDTGDAASAVREGARLFESPDLRDHPALAAFAIARPDQLDRTLPRHHDRWVRELDAEQIDRYAMLLDALVACARRHGRDVADISCEVLSTMPRPLGAVLARFGLGRWRVAQKADLGDPTDVYRMENAEPADWVMLGNHDTPPIFGLFRAWTPAHRERWARHLAARLRLRDPARLASPGYLASAMLAELLASRAENVSIFFADLFGYEDRFNTPGTYNDVNWTLRLPPDFERLHAERLASGVALDLQLAVELALAAS
jgi:4-alpha-glucanotransferase